MMPVPKLAPSLLCILSMLAPILTPASSYPQQRRCQLTQQTAACNNFNLTAVPAGLPGSIEELQLNYNLIQALRDDSLSYPSLSTLSLACNHLQRIQPNTFQDTKLLASLNLANNRLYIDYQETSHALKTLLKLRVLDLSENGLDEEMAAALLQNLTSLEYLNLSGNLLKRLDEASFAGLGLLKELDLQRNIIFEIEGAFDGAHKLQRLNLAFNYLPCLYDFHMTQLLILNASHNFIEWFISRTVLNVTFHLETLDLSHNKLLFFPFLPNRSRLRNLYLSHNSVRFYEHLAANATAENSSANVEFFNVRNHTGNVTIQLWDESMHGDVSSVEILDLRANQVEYFPEGFIQKMPSLCRFKMCKNCLKTLNLTSGQISRRLYELDVSDNQLSQMLADEGTATALGNLTYLNLSHNALGSVPSGLFSSLPALRSVDLSYNSIDICPSGAAETSANTTSTCVDWKRVASLRQLYLRGCNLQRVPLSAFAGLLLTHLELSDNPGVVSQGSIQSLSPTLQHLGLGNALLQGFDFSHFRTLEYLNISENSIASLPASLLNLGLKVLDVRDNRLSTIPTGHASTLALKLHTIFLSGNPFNCCQTDWFKTFETIDVVGRSDIECEDLFQATHRLEGFNLSSCLSNDGESVLWYILLIVPICLFFLGILIITFLTLKPESVQKSIKKKCFKPTSY